MLLTFTTETPLDLYRAYSTKPIHIPQGTFVAPDFWARRIQKLYPSTVLDGYQDYKPKPNQGYAGKRVLFDRIGGIGDLLFVMPTLRAIAEHFFSRVSIAVDSHNMTLVDRRGIADVYMAEALPVEIADDYDYVISLHDVLSVSPKNIDVFHAVARYCGIPTDWLKYDMRINTVEESEKRIAEMIDPDDLNIVYQLSASSKMKTLPREHSRFFLEAIGADHRAIWLVDRPEQSEGVYEFMKLVKNNGSLINFAAESDSPADLVALINHADIVVSPDSASVHIAAALGKPCLAVYNSFAPEHYAGHYPTVVPIDIRSDCEFAENEYRKCFELGNVCSAMKKYGKESAPCFDYLDVIDMVRRFEEMVKEI
jgi:Glycosyltransferase family 9 (heptosyltransferase)